MKKVVFLTAWLCIALSFTHAQSKTATVAGTITDYTGKSVDGATVSVITAHDSATVKSLLTNTDGKFTFTGLNAGNYLIRVVCAGYQNYKGAVFILAEGQTINLKTITIQSINKQLKQVEISAQKAMIEQKIDRTVVNVGAFISNSSANALEALEKVPGVIVDSDGNITFKGKNGVMILIDDKPTYLSGEDLASYLRSLPASSLDQIELMSNPPAKYDASGNAGVINIKTKRSKVKGLNGSVTASVTKARYYRTQETANVNYRSGNVNFFVNTGYSTINNFRQLDVHRTYLAPNGSINSFYTEQALFYPAIYSPNIKTGLDYYLSSKTIIGVVLTANTTLVGTYNPVRSSLRNGAGLLDSNIMSENHSRNENYNQGINLNYTHKFDSLGTELNFDMDYLRYNNHRSQTFDNNTYDAAGNFGGLQDITDKLPALINIYAVKSDYSHAIDKKQKFGMGLKTSFVNTDNSANYFDIINSASVVDYYRSNRFLYKENVNAGYVNYNGDFGNLSVQAGLRAESSNVSGHQLGNIIHPDSAFTQHYTDLFPTGYLLYKLDTAGHHTLNLSYGRRIDRPYYADLNPFLTILDKYSGFTGNPFLKPQYSSNYELTYNYKNMFLFQVEYHYISQYIVEYDYQQGNVFVASNANLGSRPHLGVNATLNLSPAKWWSFTFYTELVKNTFSGMLGTVPIQQSSTYLYFNDNNQFTLADGWTAQLSTFYLSPSKDTQFTHRYREQTDVAIRKKILNNKATLGLSARDIFKANFSAGEITNVPGAVISYHNDNANRSVALSFTYNFGSNKNTLKRRNTNSADSEAGRVGN